MALHTIWQVLLLCLHLLCCNATLGEKWKLSKEEDKEIECQLKILNKPAVNTIVSDFGDTYDCVDFYKQPAFDHPSLKNYKSDFKLESYAKYYKTTKQAMYDTVECPFGTVPIRRITKEDLIRATKVRCPDIKNDFPQVLVSAVARTKPGPNKYAGAGANITTHNPKVIHHEFSSSRILIRNGPDCIHAGWRVDPVLYGDTLTRVYIHTDAGQSHCFNTYCPGFIITNPSIPLDAVITNISKPGGPIYEMPLYILRDNDGNWNLHIGVEHILVGFWPWRIFTGLKHLANYVDYGGAGYLDPSYTGPELGTGWYPIGDMRKDAYFRKIVYVDWQGIYYDADDVEAYADDNRVFTVIDKGHVKGVDGHFIFYGGPGTRN